jgi:pyruvate/2-oxoglutarate dehydrogenase complex dihydrolipoamide dehydrogenase (E3) component
LGPSERSRVLWICHRTRLLSKFSFMFSTPLSVFIRIPRDHIDFNQINPRLAVEPTLLDFAYQPLSKAWKRAQLRHIRQVKRVASGEVVIIDHDGVEQTLETDGIVVATGAAYTSTLMTDSQGRNKEERRAEFVAFRDAVLNSKAGVVVIGGGITGTELIAEIATDFDKVKCTLVNKPELLLSECSSIPILID